MNKQIFSIDREQIDYLRKFIFEDEQNIDLIVSRLLLALGFKPKLFGISYLQEAIKYCYLQSSPKKFSLSGVVYPAVASMQQTTPVCVEKNIRTAVQDCYANNSILKFNALCGYEILSPQYPPANGEFISKAVAWIKSCVNTNK